MTRIDKSRNYSNVWNSEQGSITRISSVVVLCGIPWLEGLGRDSVPTGIVATVALTLVGFCWRTPPLIPISPLPSLVVIVMILGDFRFMTPAAETETTE